MAANFNPEASDNGNMELHHVAIETSQRHLVKFVVRAANEEGAIESACKQLTDNQAYMSFFSIFMQRSDRRICRLPVRRLIFQLSAEACCRHIQER